MANKPATKPDEAKIETTVTTPSAPKETEPSRADLEAQIASLRAELSAKTEAVELTPVEEVAASKSEMPIPADFQAAVNEGLNKRFGVEIEYSSDTPFFGFSILVPKEYSNAAKPHWDMYKEDRRTRMISNAENLNGVKLWVERVYNNFDNETKARITSDRHNQHV